MREPDPIWDALENRFGPVRTRSERGRRNVAVKELRDAEATPEQIDIAYEFCRRSFSYFTEVALCQHFSRALHQYMMAFTPTALGKIRRMAGDDEA